MNIRRMIRILCEKDVVLVNMLCKIIVLCLFAVCSCGEDGNGVVFDKPEGSSCSWNGLEGRCTNISNCPSAQDAIRWKKHPAICSFDGMIPIVCCTLRTKDPTDNIGLDSRFDKTSKARDNCLKYLTTLGYPCSVILVRPFGERSLSDNNCSDNQAPPPLQNVRSTRSFGDFNSQLKRHADYSHNVPAISHGTAAYRQQYPHMALLGYGDDLKTAQWLCGGSLISEKYILTAAHCISSPAVGPVKFVALGILKRSDPPELWQTHNVKRIIGHPDYKPPSKYNDIALLETENTISFNTDVLPACLQSVPESGETAIATGWGALGHRQGLADTLQAVVLVRYDEEKCSQLYPKHRHLRYGYNHTSQMCYGDKYEAKDTCEGDSGGPLQTTNEFANCAYTLLGVTSYGRQCGISAGSGMYTRVYHYVPWIESIVWP